MPTMRSPPPPPPPLSLAFRCGRHKVPPSFSRSLVRSAIPRSARSRRNRRVQPVAPRLAFAFAARTRTNALRPCVPHLAVGAAPAWKRHCAIRIKRVIAPGATSVATASPTVMAAAETTEPSCSGGPTAISDQVDQVKSFFIGWFGGLLGSLAGMGGGFVMIPLMAADNPRYTSLLGERGALWMGGLGLNQHQAHGTSLFAVGTTGLAGALGYGIMTDGDDESSECFCASNENTTSTTEEMNRTTPTTEGRYKRQGLVEIDTAIALASTAVVTARIGANASSRLSARSLQKALGAFMICVAPLVPGNAYLKERSLHPYDKKMSRSERLVSASFVGIFSGFLSGMFGVGGGAIVVPALVLFTDMTHHAALGTSLCAMVPPAIMGTVAHSRMGNVNWRFAPMLALGSATGAFIGGREVGLHLPEGILRAGFSCLMLFLGLKTFRKGVI